MTSNNTTRRSSSSSLDEADCDALDELLNNLDIDKDFDVWRSSMRSSGRLTSSACCCSGGGVGLDSSSFSEEMGTEVSLENHNGTSPTTDNATNNNNNTTAAAAPQLDQENANIQRLHRQDKAWAQRLQREEVYSRLYRPSPAERAELDDLERTLELPNPSSQTKNNKKNRLLRLSSNDETNGAANNDRTAWNLLLHPQGNNKKKQQPHSILLKRGPCLWQRHDYNKDKLGHQATECEVLLLTHGLVVVAAPMSTTTTTTQRRRQVARVILWSQVAYAEPGEDDTAWRVQLQKENEDESWTFGCATSRQRHYWLQALERVLVEYHTHANGSKVAKNPTLGWQYRYMHRPGFYQAVTNNHVVDDDDNDNNLLSEAALSNKLDDYHGYAPLHYAVRLQNLQAVQVLLQAGANPNQPDREEGRTPMDYCDDSTNDIVQLLVQYGGQRTDWDRGALFGQVEAVQEKREQKRQAQAAQAQQKIMNENMRLLQQRGEQIDELGNKATELNQGAQDFASMAKQLKEKSKSSKWLPF